MIRATGCGMRWRIRPRALCGRSNGNGRYDAGEPFTDLGAVDPTPADIRYPIRNSPSVVRFVQGSDVPDSTFTVATFALAGQPISTR